MELYTWVPHETEYISEKKLFWQWKSQQLSQQEVWIYVITENNTLIHKGFQNYIYGKQK